MATEFRAPNGKIVARRNWGGDTEGVRITLEPAAATIAMHDVLLGSDGSRATLRILASEVGSGRSNDYVGILARRYGPSPKRDSPE